MADNHESRLESIHHTNHSIYDHGQAPGTV